ncbi:MAG: flagellar motor protein MotB, partial [Pseudomonadota bacterium]
GAWKVAYADFVTAMMAFFLLLWLLNVTTSDQKQAIAFYFDPFSVSSSNSGSGGVLGGQSMVAPGAALSDTTAPGLETALPVANNQGDNQGNDASIDRDINRDGGFSDLDGGEMLSVEEVRQNNEVAQQLFANLADRDLLDQVADNLIVEQTTDGLRIQIVDTQRRPMFAPGEVEPLPFVEEILASIVEAIADISNKVDISGHTDASLITTRDGEPYDNWDLSADRANASRRVMIGAGLEEVRLSRVVGKAATNPLLPDQPLSPSNRRISLVLLRDDQPDLAEDGPGGLRANDPNYRRIVPVPEAIVPLPSSRGISPVNATPLEDRIGEPTLNTSG